MFGLKGLTRILGGMKKGPLFSWPLRCTLTYFWDRQTMKVIGVDCGGGGGGSGKSQLPLVCVWGECTV